MGVIDDQSQMLSVLVTQLLDVIRIQSSKLMLKLELTNLGALAEGIVPNLRQQTSVHLIEIRISGEVTALSALPRSIESACSTHTTRQTSTLIWEAWD